MSDAVSIDRTWDIPMVPLSPNEILGRHWSKKHGEAKKWRRAIGAVCKHAPKGAITGRVFVEIGIYRERLLDPDNAVAACKPILDALKRYGWLVDDSEQFLELSVFQRVIQREEQGVEIVLVHPAESKS